MCAKYQMAKYHYKSTIKWSVLTMNYILYSIQNSLHQFFTNLKSQAFSLHIIFTFWEPTYSGGHASLFCLMIAWVVAKLYWYKIWSVETSFIHWRQKSINSYTCIHWDVMTRDVINSVCSPLVIHTLKLYRISLYFSPCLFIKNNRIVS